MTRSLIWFFVTGMATVASVIWAIGIALYTRVLSYLNERD
jgi:hypothetical protein